MKANFVREAVACESVVQGDRRFVFSEVDGIKGKAFMIGGCTQCEEYFLFRFFCGAFELRWAVGHGPFKGGVEAAAAVNGAKLKCVVGALYLDPSRKSKARIVFGKIEFKGAAAE